MLSFALYATAQLHETDFIEDALNGLHWVKAQGAEVKLLEQGFVRLSKVSHVSLRNHIEQYVSGSVNEIVKAEWPHEPKLTRHTEYMLRCIDIGVLNRLLITKAPFKSFNFSKDPTGILGNESPWTRSGISFRLAESNGLFIGSGETYDVVGEFDLLIRNLEGRSISES